MAVSVTCPGCRTSYPVTEDLLGKKIRCKKCQETFTAATAKTAAGSRRAADERITTKPGTRAAGRYDDEDDAPARNGNGRGRPLARPAPKKGGNGLLIGGIAGGLLLLAVGIGLGVWLLKPDDTGDTNQQQQAASLPIGNVTPGTPPDTTPKPDTKVTPKADGPAVKAEPTMRTADAPDKLVVVRDMPRPANIQPTTVDRIKKSAVWITTTSAEGQSWGSGWVAERHGNEAYVVTNAHVVGMWEAAKPPPEKLDVCFDAGLPTERHYDGKLLAIDRGDDLAVIRVKGRDLPDALKIAPSYDLQESQRLFSMGFPHGGRLVKDLQRGLNTGELKTTLKVRPTTVSGRIFKADGSVKYVQIEGGVDPGNSGGAAVDTNGNVVAVVVAQAPGTNMKFIIPGEYVIHLLLGRLQSIVPGQGMASGGGVRQPLAATIADPLKRLRKVDAEVWTGTKPDEVKGEKPVRPGGDREPQPKDGDGPKVVAAFTLDRSNDLKLGESFAARAELTLPPLPANQVYWFRPHYYAKDGSERWGEAIVLEMGRHPVDAKPAHLAIQHKPERNPAEARRLDLNSRQKLGFMVEGLGQGGFDRAVKASLTERVTQVEKDGDARMRIHCVDLVPADKDTEAAMRKQLKGVLESAKDIKLEVTVTKEGKYKSPVEDFQGVPTAARPFLRSFSQQVLQSLEVMALSLPGKDVQPGETWGHESEYTFSLDPKNNQNSIFKLTCKYVGSRVRDGRQEGVVEIVGTVVKNNSNSDPNRGDRAAGRGSRGLTPGRPDDGNPGDGNNEGLINEDGELKVGLHGFVRGAAVIDVATGHVTLARTESDLAVVFPVTFRDPENPQEELNTKVYAGAYLDVTLRRSLTKDPPKAVDVAALLPNQAREYNPLVGVGPPTVGESVVSTAPAFPERATLMAPEVWERVRRAAVMLKVDRNDGGGEGSGWFAAPGIVVTNCHVVGMLTKADRPPEKITVFIERGTDKELEVEGELLAVDRVEDLAVVRVKSDRLPEPMKITPSAPLIESDRLSVLGFPRGSGLYRQTLEIGLNNRDLQITLKARDTTVAGRVPNLDGSVKYIQIEGGADPGNSGGAIVDAKGNVRAVLVAGDPSSQMRFAIPSEYADRMVQGYPLEVFPRRAYLDGSVPKQPIEVRYSDPLGRLSAVALDYWVGSNGKPRKPADKKPAAAPGDGTRQTIALALKPGERPGEKYAAGEFVLPDASPGQVIWLQPRFTNGTGKEQWARAIPFAPDGPAVERKPALLAVKHKRGTSRDVELITFTNLYSKQLGKGQRDGLPVKTTLTEHVLAVSQRGTATVNLEYQALELELKKIFPGLEDAPREIHNVIAQRLKPFLSLIRGVITVVEVNKDGKMRLRGLTYGQLPLQAQPQMHQFNTQILASLQALTFPLPGKEVPYGYTWEFPTDLFINSANKSDGAVFTMKFKYVGVRDRGGRQEAVVEINGALAGKPDAKGLDSSDDKADAAKQPDEGAEPGSPGSYQAQDKKRKKGLYGVAEGYAYVDVRDGFVSEVKLWIDLDVEMTTKDAATKKDVPVDAGGTMELHLRRRTTQVSR